MNSCLRNQNPKQKKTTFDNLCIALKNYCVSYQTKSDFLSNSSSMDFDICVG